MSAPLRVSGNLHGIGPEALARLWISREIEERAKNGPSARANLIAAMRREMQEACGLVADPAKLTENNLAAESK